MLNSRLGSRFSSRGRGSDQEPDPDQVPAGIFFYRNLTRPAHFGPCWRVDHCERRRHLHLKLLSQFGGLIHQEQHSSRTDVDRERLSLVSHDQLLTKRFTHFERTRVVKRKSPDAFEVLRARRHRTSRSNMVGPLFSKCSNSSQAENTIYRAYRRMRPQYLVDNLGRKF